MQLNLFTAIERLTVQDGLSVFHEIEGRHKGKSYKTPYVSIREFFRERYLETITGVDVENYRRYLMNDGMKGSTANRYHSVLTRMFNALYEWRATGLVQGYNFAALKLPIKNPGELVSKVDERQFARTLVLTPMELFKYCDYAHPNVRVIALLAVLTLLRRKNLQFLNKDNFNAALKQIQVTQSKTGVHLTIPASRTVEVIINESKYSVICDFTNFRKLHERARRESGVYFWMTDLRRTGATQMLLDGIDLRTIQRYLGHTTLVMTERYVQPPVQHMVTAAETLEKRFESAAEMTISRR